MSISTIAITRPTIKEGKLLSNYRLGQLLGNGGSASVYLGEHIFLGTQVAIKVLREPHRETALQQMQNEVHIVSKLKHPNVIKILSFDMEGEIPYLVMEYASAGSLRELYPVGTLLPLHTVLHYAKQAALALQYIHRQGLIHRDIKPENLLLTHSSRVLLCDFGIALVESEAKRAQCERVGTATYMAPEQIRGYPCIHSDQYSLAAMIYEMLCGEPPFRGSSLAIAHQHLSTKPIALRTRLRHFSVAVDNVIMQALAKEPADRFSSVQEFIGMLEAACKVCIY